MVEEANSGVAQTHEHGHEHAHHEHANPEHQQVQPHAAHQHADHRKKENIIKKYKIPILATAVYLLIALVMFYPITSHITSVTPGTGGDSYINLWSIWWVNYATFNLHTSIYFSNFIFWPFGVNLVYWTQTPLQALLTLPLQAVNLIFAYNIMLFAGFAATGLGMYLLADYIVKNKYAAFIAGLIFTFSSVHIAQGLAHIDFIQLEWIPLFVFFALRTLNGYKSYFDILGMAACFALATLMGVIEESLMLLLVLILIIIAFLIYRNTRKLILSKNFAISMVLFLVLAFIIGSWNFIPIIHSIGAPGGVATAQGGNDIQHNMIWSTNLLSFFVPSFYNGIFYGLSGSAPVYNALYAPDPTERVAYVGFLAIILGLFGIYKNWKQSRLWVAFAVIFGWLSLGPLLQIGSDITGVPTLYYLYHFIPLLNVIREPGRFNILLIMAVAVLAAFGVKSLLERMESGAKAIAKPMTRALALVAVISIIMLVESNGLSLGPQSTANISTPVAVPPFYYQVANLTYNFSVLQLPILPLKASSYMPEPYTGEATYYTYITHKPEIGGYIARINLTNQLSLYNVPLIVQASNLDFYGTLNFSSPVSQNYTNQTLLTLNNYETAFVVVAKGAYNQTSLNLLESYLLSVFGNPVYNDNTTIAFSTADALNKSIYNSFVAYPSLTLWSSTSILYNGTSKTVWVPTGNGQVIVYAPYQNATVLNAALTTGLPSMINTTIRFNALTDSQTGTGTLYIAEPSASGGYTTIAALNLTNRISSYQVSTQMESGPNGNILFFASASQSYDVALSNITFSRN
ncbi:MAG TPA: hypothetical protein VMV00_00790 [Candidatus Baltobacteraceae bacterium]|nr:hypothetical protein [Candidatus Baltobacteraceae bacterium]